jgi:excisionase family DNA binding protein
MIRPHRIDDDAPTADAAEILGLTTETVKKYCQRGVLSARKFGSSWMVLRSDIDRYRANRRPPGRPKSQEN